MLVVLLQNHNHQKPPPMGANSPLIRRIIHKITNRIPPRHIQPRTTILPLRTPRRRRRLLPRILNEIPRIPRRARITLERMQQPKPMPDLVHRRLAHLVPLHATLRHRAEQHVAAVLGVRGGGVGDWGGAGGGAGGARGLVDDGLREGAVAEEGLARGGGGGGGGEVGLEVDI